MHVLHIVADFVEKELHTNYHKTLDEFVNSRTEKFSTLSELAMARGLRDVVVEDGFNEDDENVFNMIFSGIQVENEWNTEILVYSL